MYARVFSAAGYSLVELMFVAGLTVTLSAIAVPQLLVGLDDARAAGAARYVSARLQRTRMEAVVRSTPVALQFVDTGAGYTYAVYRDGNGNGVRMKEIQQNIDPPVDPPERLSDQFAGVDFGVIPALPAVEPGGAPPGNDPIRLGASNILTFTAIGTSSAGSLYILGRRSAQYVVRVFGTTGKTRVLKFDLQSGQWKPL